MNENLLFLGKRRDFLMTFSHSVIAEFIGCLHSIFLHNKRLTHRAIFSLFVAAALDSFAFYVLLHILRPRRKYMMWNKFAEKSSTLWSHRELLSHEARAGVPKIGENSLQLIFFFAFAERHFLWIHEWVLFVKVNGHKTVLLSTRLLKACDGDVMDVRIFTLASLITSRNTLN